jgi:hypothetical protein
MLPERTLQPLGPTQVSPKEEPQYHEADNR